MLGGQLSAGLGGGSDGGGGHLGLRGDLELQGLEAVVEFGAGGRELRLGLCRPLQRGFQFGAGHSRFLIYDGGGPLQAREGGA